MMGKGKFMLNESLNGTVRILVGSIPGVDSGRANFIYYYVGTSISDAFGNHFVVSPIFKYI
jgi:hypothetical protein